MGRFTLPLAQVFTSSGRLGAGYQLSFFTTGTSAPLDTYSNEARTVANSNPVIADASGIFDDIFLADVPYKVTLQDADDVLVWTADPVSTAVGEIGIPVPLSKGGTGAITAALARTSLGLGTAATYTIGEGNDEVPTNSMVSGVPTGAILLWYGSLGTIPAGWTICDGGTYSKVDGSGSIATPDLRDRFVIGATTTYAQGSSGGSAAGATTGASGSLTMTVAAAGDHNHAGSTDGHTLTSAQIGAHSHQMFANQGLTSTSTGDYAAVGWFPSHNSQYGIQGSSTVATVYKTADNSGGGGSHSHGLQASGTHTHGVTGGDHTHSMTGGLPPYFALIYILKL
jgi:hypothetical protein